MKKKVRLAGVIKAWLERYFCDFEEEIVANKLLSFLDIMVWKKERDGKEKEKIYLFILLQITTGKINVGCGCPTQKNVPKISR